MRNIVVLTILIGCFAVAKGQVFRGTVYDKETGGTVYNAVIYVNGTSNGTTSDINGNFELDISDFGTLPITVSMLGYSTATLTHHSTKIKHDIYLTPKIFELNDVVITAKANSKTPKNKQLKRISLGEPKSKAYLNQFKRFFLGDTKNARECTIINEIDIDFTYDLNDKTLRAYCRNPILIQNKALGYFITYYLENFKYSDIQNKTGFLTEMVNLMGHYLFKDEIAKYPESEQRKIEKNRRLAYLGSRMHFFRLLYSGNISQSGIYDLFLQDKGLNEFYISSDRPVDKDSFISKGDSLTAKIVHRGELSIEYKFRKTKMNVLVDSVYFEKKGYFDPICIEFSGEMSKQLVGDLLPFEYQYR